MLESVLTTFTKHYVLVNNSYSSIFVIITLYYSSVLAPSCQQLISELLSDAVACRYQRFAIQLGLSPDTIEVISMNHRDAHRCLINVINHWVNNYEVSWDAVTNALDGIDCRNMAETIRMKYNIVLVV